MYMYGDVKPVVKIVVSMELHTVHALGGLLFHTMLYFGEAITVLPEIFAELNFRG